MLAKRKGDIARCGLNAPQSVKQNCDRSAELTPRPDEQKPDTRQAWPDELATDSEVHIHQGSRM